MSKSNLKSATTETYSIKTVSKYLDYIRKIEKDANEVIFYRGHSDVNYELIPSIGRKKKEEEKNLYDKADEKQIFLDFKKRYYSFTDSRLTEDIDILFLAQHHELPTRLLDWSNNPLIALYFACQHHENKDGQVYSIKITNARLEEGHSFDFLNPKEYKQEYMPILPDDIHIRYIHQSGLFVLFRNPYIPLQISPSFTIKNENKQDILKELALLGITDSYVLPTLDNLCKEIKNKYQK